jgi:RNA polymerase sigma-70 factor (ECF subfamily)
MAALRQLPVGQREAIALHYLADLPLTEVADLLQVSDGTVKSRLSRGRLALGRLLGDTETLDPPDQPSALSDAYGAESADNSPRSARHV